MAIPRSTRSRWGIPLLCFALLASTASAALRDARSATVSFKAKTTVFMVVEGRGQELSVADDGKVITLRVPLDSISTGIKLRDRHMRESLNTERYPNAELKVTRSALSFPADRIAQSGSTQGELTLHGKTRPTVVDYRAERSNGSYRVEGTLAVDLHEFGIRPPNYAGVTVKPKVDVTAKFTAQG
jgi:polyisoprenoid-binding protein YceI